MGYVISAILAYLLGSSNLAYFISRWQGKDIRKGGSGNYGASNATLTMGWVVGVAVAVHDIGKAVIAVLLARLLFPGLAYVGTAAGVACVLGHIFPFYLRFKGGKGFASFLGMTLALNWKLAIAVMLLVVIVTVISDYIVVGTMSAISIVPVGMGVLEKSWIISAIILIATAVILWKHRQNLVRIWKRQEIGLRSAIRGDHRM